MRVAVDQHHHDAAVNPKWCKYPHFKLNGIYNVYHRNVWILCTRRTVPKISATTYTLHIERQRQTNVRWFVLNRGFYWNGIYFGTFFFGTFDFQLISITFLLIHLSFRFLETDFFKFALNLLRELIIQTKICGNLINKTMKNKVFRTILGKMIIYLNKMMMKKWKILWKFKSLAKRNGEKNYKILWRKLEKNGWIQTNKLWKMKQML